MWVGLSKMKFEVRVMRMSKGVMSSMMWMLASTWWSSNTTTIFGDTISVMVCMGVLLEGPMGKLTSATSYNITRWHLPGVRGGILRSSSTSYWESSRPHQRGTMNSFADLSRWSACLWSEVHICHNGVWICGVEHIFVTTLWFRGLHAPLISLWLQSCQLWICHGLWLLLILGIILFSLIFFV